MRNVDYRVVDSDTILDFRLLWFERRYPDNSRELLIKRLSVNDRFIYLRGDHGFLPIMKLGKDSWGFM